MDQNNASTVRQVAVDDDVLASLYPGQPHAVSGEALFVINLCAAMTPQSPHADQLAGLEQYKLYQVSRIEDGRRRYRLRLGFFANEAQAEDVLSRVRQHYATAFTTCLCEEDLKHASGYLHCSVADLERTGCFTRPDFRPHDTTRTTALQPALPHSAVARSAASMPPVAATPAISAQVPARTAAPALNPIAPPTVATPTSVKPARLGLMRHAQVIEQQAVATGERKVLAAKFEAQATGRHVVPAKVEVPVAKPVAAAPNKPAIAVPTVAVATSAPATTATAVPLPPAAVAAAPVPPPAAPVPLTAYTPPPVVAPAAKETKPFHVGHGAHIPETTLTLAGETGAAKAVPRHAAGPTVVPAIAPSIAPKNAENWADMSDLMRARALAKQSAQWRQQHGEVPTLDTTQTIRTLTKKELDDVNVPKWFSVQLAISDQPANLDTMPRLDIFEAYCLYSVAAMDGGRIRHALRLGFFREEVSAEAVTGYLRTFFGEPTIVRIADSEQERFANGPKPKPAATTVVAMEPKRAPAAIPQPAAVKPVAKPAPAARTVARAATPATKHAPLKAATPKKPVKPKLELSPEQRSMLEEARMLGLTDTQILRVQKNPSLLSRLVGKLTK
jgi:hypothetical protein